MALSEWQEKFLQRYYPPEQYPRVIELIEQTGYGQEQFEQDQKIINSEGFQQSIKDGVRELINAEVISELDLPQVRRKRSDGEA